MRPERISAAKAWAALVIVWFGLTVAASVLVERDDEVLLLLPLLGGLVGALSLWRAFARAGLVSGALGTVGFIGVRLLTEGDEGLAMAGGVALVGLVGIGLLAEQLGEQTERDALRRRHDARLIEELTPVHGPTGVLKWRHAARELVDELAAARRYRYAVTLVLLHLDEWSRVAEGSSSDEVLDEVGRLLVQQVRTTDRVAYRGEGEFVIILPHTSLAGGLAVVEKTRARLGDELALDQRAGVAEFPTDAGTADDLVREAESALEVAHTTSLRVASRELLGGY